jgi:hypothetical protein
MAELLDVEKSNDWDGKSYKPAIINGGKSGHESLVISQMAHVCQRSAVFDDWLYIRTYHCGFHLFDDEMLYNLKDDVYERNDVKKTHPEICMKGAKIILDWHDAMMKKSVSEIDPLWTVLKEGGPFHTVGQLEGYIKRLHRTNRSEGAAELAEKYHM